MSGFQDHVRGTGDGRSPWGTRLVLTLTAIGAATGLASLLPASPRLVWNDTSSVPVGLYAIAQKDPQPGDLLAINIQGEPRRLLEAAGALRPAELLLKPLAGRTGDVVCRIGNAVSVNARAVAHARDAVSGGAELPRWSGCRTLMRGEILILSDHPASFDSRYFGPIRTSDVVGVATPVLLSSPAQENK